MKKIVCLVGESGSGKSSLAEMVEEFGHTTLPSYTTRPKRNNDEKGHTFVTEDQFNKLEDLVAYTEFNGFKYGATKKQLENYDIYIIDLPGLNELVRNLGRENIISIYIKSGYGTRIDRMIETRGVASAIQRICHDEKAFKDKDEHEFDFVLRNENQMDLASNVLELDYIISSLKYYGDE